MSTRHSLRCIMLLSIVGIFIILVRGEAQERNQAVLILKHNGSVNAVAFSPDGKDILTACSDGIVRLWEATTGREIKRIQADKWCVYCAAFSPDGKRIVTGGAERKVKVWDVKTRHLLLTFTENPVPIYCVAFSPDGKRIASGGGGERSGGEDDRLLVWDAATGHVQLTIHTGGFGIHSVAFSPDGKRLVLADEALIPIKVWDARTGRVLATLKTKEEDWGVGEVVFSPDGKHIATASMGGRGAIWDAKTGKAVLTLKGHKDWVLHIAYSPDGKRLVTGSGSEDKTARVWDASNGRELQVLPGHEDYIGSVAFSPDGNRVVTGSGNADRTARIWNVVARSELARFHQHQFSNTNKYDHTTQDALALPSQTFLGVRQDERRLSKRYDGIRRVRDCASRPKPRASGIKYKGEPGNWLSSGMERLLISANAAQHSFQTLLQTFCTQHMLTTLRLVTASLGLALGRQNADCWTHRGRPLLQCRQSRCDDGG